MYVIEERNDIMQKYFICSSNREEERNIISTIFLSNSLYIYINEEKCTEEEAK